MKPILALSTCWCSHRHQDGYEMLKEMADLDFEYVELSHGVRITLVPGILRAVKERVVKICSAHNFCPLPTGVTRAAPNLYEPSAREDQEREQWQRHTKRTIDFAAQLNARVVVCHLGSVKFPWLSPERTIARYLQKNPGAGLNPADERYRAVLEKSVAKLRKAAVGYQERMNASVRDILADAKKEGVLLGFENRERFDELPLDEDWMSFLGGVGADAPMGYWHDTGHAALKENIGLLRHREQLTTLEPWTIGFHLHDVSMDGHDHQPVGSGGIDFKMVSRFWRPAHLLVLELSPRVTTEDVLSSKRAIEALMK